MSFRQTHFDKLTSTGSLRQAHFDKLSASQRIAVHHYFLSTFSLSAWHYLGQTGNHAGSQAGLALVYCEFGSEGQFRYKLISFLSRLTTHLSSLNTSCFHKNPFHLVFNILPNQLLYPGYKCIVPALGVEVEHGLFWKCSFIHCPDDITGGVVL